MNHFLIRSLILMLALPTIIYALPTIIDTQTENTTILDQESPLTNALSLIELCGIPYTQDESNDEDDEGLTLSILFERQLDLKPVTIRIKCLEGQISFLESVQQSYNLQIKQIQSVFDREMDDILLRQSRLSLQVESSELDWSAHQTVLKLLQAQEDVEKRIKALEHDLALTIEQLNLERESIAARILKYKEMIASLTESH